MEKRGVIEKGRTPEEDQPFRRDEKPAAAEGEKTADTSRVNDDHLTSRAADQLQNQLG